MSRLGSQLEGACGQLRRGSERRPWGLVRIGRRGEHSIGDVELQRFAEAIRSGGREEVSAADGLRSVAMGVAAHRSIDEARPVSVSEGSDPSDWPDPR